MSNDLSPGQRRTLWIGAVLLLIGFLAYAGFALGDWRGQLAEEVIGIWVYEGVIVGASISCLLRAVLIPRERLGWGLMAVALAAYAAGELHYLTAASGGGEVPTPSPADAGYLAFYPIAYLALIALAREQIGGFPPVRWLDGVIVGGAVAALATALALGPIVDDSVSGDAVAVAVNLAYPIADVVLLSMVVAVAALSGWRPGPSWMLLGGALTVTAVSDVVYLFEAARGSYAQDGALDVGWSLGLLTIAASAWLPPARAGRHRSSGVRTALFPALAALVALAVLFAERWAAVPFAASIISLLTLLGVVLRLALSFTETQQSLESSQRDALTDPLTGLGNRRRFMEALGRAMEPRPRGRVGLLVLFDLDGFKAYNDAFGHPAGDALLIRLGEQLQRYAQAANGRAYRLGGDEFCLLGDCTAAEVEGIVAEATAALSEEGNGFAVSAARGSVLIPAEASTPETALQLADRRMYAHKSRERTSAGRQSRDVLMSALRERQPDLHRHLVSVADLSQRVAREVGLEGEQLDEVFRAAELHDVGKVAIPDAILSKPGPLEEREMEFMRTHTLIGERIIAAAPALVPVARLVRSSHERPDGKGYPDGLSGEEIPIGSRIIAVCDAYQAMVTERPYSTAMRPTRALEELRSGAGTQFDPDVVVAFARVVEEAGGDAVGRPATDAADGNGASARTHHPR